MPASFLKGVFVLALAEPASADACPTAKELDAQIVNCGHNSVAVERARECMHAVRAEGQAAVAELQRTASSSDRQALFAAIEKATRRIEAMQALTEKAASYPRAMIDIPGSARKETSLDCFNESFEELQKLVTAMDKEIIHAKKARLRSVRLLKRCSNACAGGAKRGATKSSLLARARCDAQRRRRGASH
jgi:hypothetical protein